MTRFLIICLLFSFSPFAAAVLNWSQGPVAVPILGPFGLGALAVLVTLAAVRIFRRRP